MAMFRYEDGALPHGLAMLWIAGGYGGGIALLGQPSLAANAAGVVLLASAFVIAAYFIHECSHNTVFRDAGWNVRLGHVLSWIVGACYTPLVSIVEKHMVHHTDRIDNVSYDYRPLLRRRPWLASLFRALEFCYVPAVELWMHLVALTAPWHVAERREDRGRVLAVLAVRGACFALLWVWSPRAVLGYALAYVLFVHVLRFMDCFQHTYALRVVNARADLAELARQSRDYEQDNTFSNPLSVTVPPVNWLTLNFSFHNAHHLKPSEPWYRLPAIHREMYGSLAAHTLSFAQLLANYHRFRTARVLDDYGDEGQGLGDVAQFAGALGVSFLTQY